MKLSRYILNVAASFLPPTRLFGLKRALYRAAGVSVASGVKINSHCTVLGNGDLSIGTDTWVGVNARFVVPDPAKVNIGENCDIAPDVAFVCGSHTLGNSTRRAGPGTLRNIEIGSGSWIGSRALILPGVVIGPGCVIAAGAVVLPGDYPRDSLIAGNPASVRKSYAD